MHITDAIKFLADNKNLSSEQMELVMRSIMSGEASPIQVSGFLVALAIKGETTTEICSAAQVMRDLCRKVELTQRSAIDIVGTGGDGASLFNVSTAASIVVAAGGGVVAKHGNRSVTSSSGSADLLEQAGVNLDLTPEQVLRCIEEVGVGFMFAVNHHPAMKYAAKPRKELKLRTIFNILGPLSNPASPSYMLVGVYDKKLLEVYASVLCKLGVKRAFVVRGDDGLDELSIFSTTRVMEVRDGVIKAFTLAPESFGLKRIRNQATSGLVVSSPEESLDVIKKAFNGRHNPAADMIAMNAGAAFYIMGVTPTMKQGVMMAQDIIGGGLALAKLEELILFTQVFKQ
jgi:anthranilate phosphoribosyltransferase